MTVMVKKYQGPAVAWVVGLLVSGVLNYIAEGNEWVGKALLSILSAASQGNITEVNGVVLTSVLTPIVASIIQAVVAAVQGNGIEEVQKANGDLPDRWIGPETIKGATKN